MNNNLYPEILIFIETFYGGCILGLLYHTITISVYRITKKVMLSDICFCIVFFIFTINLFYKTTYFDLRYYSILGFLLGFILYYYLISSFYKLLLNYVFNKFENFKNIIKNKLKERKYKFYIKHKKKILKVKSLLKNIKSIPLKIKMSYNKFNIYRNKEGLDNGKTTKTKSKKKSWKEKKSSH